MDPEKLDGFWKRNFPFNYRDFLVCMILFWGGAWCGADGEFHQILMRNLKDLLIFAYEEITLYWYKICHVTFPLGWFIFPLGWSFVRTPKPYLLKRRNVWKFLFLSLSLFFFGTDLKLYEILTCWSFISWLMKQWDVDPTFSIYLYIYGWYRVSRSRERERETWDASSLFDAIKPYIATEFCQISFIIPLWLSINIS